MKRRNFLKLFGLLAVPTSAFAVLPEKIDKSKRVWLSMTFLYDQRLQGRHRIKVFNKDESKSRDYGWSNAVRTEFGVEPGEMLAIKTESGLFYSFEPKMRANYPQWQHIDIRTELYDTFRLALDYVDV